LFGGKGDDAYLLATGSGQDVVDDGGGRNTLRFAAGIDGESVAIRHDASDLLIALGDGSKTWIRGGWVDERISSLAFADGTSLTNAQLRARAQSLLPGEALANLGPAPVFGTAGDDTLTGGELFGDAGDDLLRGSGALPLRSRRRRGYDRDRSGTGRQQRRHSDRRIARGWSAKILRSRAPATTW
jgi:hypothetical protein